MNWKIWTWPGQVAKLQREVAVLKNHNSLLNRESNLVRNNGNLLTIARRALARSKNEGLTDDQMAEAFTHLLENKGFEAILQLLTSEELEAVDSMVGAKASFEEMKHHAGAVAALSQFHARLVELEEQAKAMAKKAAA